MNRRHFLGVAATASLTGCTGFVGDEEHGDLDLTVQNDRDGPVSVDVEVVDDEGTTYEEASDQINSGVARSFQVTVGSAGRHEVTVSGEGWRGQLAWNVDTCALFDGTVRVTPESVEVAGECAEPQ